MTMWCNIFREQLSRWWTSDPSLRRTSTAFHAARAAASNKTERPSLSSASIRAPCRTRYSTRWGWLNIAAWCSGVIFWASLIAKHLAFSWGCDSNINLTISMAPWAQARWAGVDRSCCWVLMRAPESKHNFTAYHGHRVGVKETKIQNKRSRPQSKGWVFVQGALDLHLPWCHQREQQSEEEHYHQRPTLTCQVYWFHSCWQRHKNMTKYLHYGLVVAADSLTCSRMMKQKVKGNGRGECMRDKTSGSRTLTKLKDRLKCIGRGITSCLLEKRNKKQRNTLFEGLRKKRQRPERQCTLLLGYFDYKQTHRREELKEKGKRRGGGRKEIRKNIGAYMYRVVTILTRNSWAS